MDEIRSGLREDRQAPAISSHANAAPIGPNPPATPSSRPWKLLSRLFLPWQGLSRLWGHIFLGEPLQPDRYVAFISYRHVEPDRTWAIWLHGTLETYRVPRPLRAKLSKRRIGRVFRDEEELAASSHLSTDIEQALDRSDWLIVICSPRSRESHWVNAEVEYFKKGDRADRILALLIEGEPDSAFPEGLYSIRSEVETGRLLQQDEPLAADVRSTPQSRRGPTKRMAKLRLIATMLSCRFDELRQREQDRQIQRLATYAGFISIVLVGFAVLAYIAVDRGNEANRQRIAAEQQRDVLHARQLAGQAQALIETGIGDMLSRGTLLAVEAMRRWPSAEATEALQRVLRSRRPLLWESEGADLGPGALAFSPDNLRLVALGATGDPARLLDAATGAKIQSLEPSPKSIAWNPAGTTIAGATNDKVVMWSTVDGKVVGAVLHPNVSALAFAPKGDRLATGDGRVIRIWQVPEGNLLASLSRPLKSDYAEASSLSFHPYNDILASIVDVGDPNETEGFKVEVWSVGKRTLLRTLKFEGPVNSASFSHDGRLLAVGIRGTVRLIDTVTWKERSRVGSDKAVDMVSVNFDRSDRLVAAVGWDEPARVWSVSDGHEIARLEHERGASGPGRISEIALSPSGRYAATIGDSLLRVWGLDAKESTSDGSLRQGQDDRRLNEFGDATKPKPGEEGIVRDYRGSLELRWQGERATLTDLSKGTELAILNYPEPILRGFVSPDGQLAALLGAKGSVQVFDAMSGREFESLRQSKDEKMVALSGVASLVAFVHTDGTLRVFSTKDGHSVQNLHFPEKVEWISFSPTGRWLLTSVDGSVFTSIKVGSGEVAARFSHDRPISTFLFTTDERYLATASDSDGTARIWDLEKNRNLLRWHLKTNLRSVGVSFANDETIFQFTGEDYDSSASSLSGLWRPQDLIRAACATVSRDLSIDEWSQYFLPQEPVRRTCEQPRPKK